MSMLAERKRKTKWVINPTKKPLWTTDSNGIRFGKELMEKMGWSTGKGLGVNEQGIQEPLRVSYKNDTKGMGFKGNDDDWIEQQDEFNELLSQLRKEDTSVNVSKIEIKSLEEKSKQSRVRVHYQKFTRGKDLSQYSENDLACILGTSKIKKENSKTEDVSETEPKAPNSFETSFGVTTINSGSIKDYFKKKWIIDENAKDLPVQNKEVKICSQNSFKSESCFVAKNEENLASDFKEKKRKKRKHVSDSVEEPICVNKTSKNKFDALENVENNENVKEEVENDLKEPKAKKRKKHCGDNVFVEEIFIETTNNFADAAVCNYESENLEKKKKRKDEKDLGLRENNSDCVVKNTRKSSSYENCISDAFSYEKPENKKEKGNALGLELNEKKKKKKSKKEKVKENCDSVDDLIASENNQNDGEELEFVLEIKSVKKEKKENEEKLARSKKLKSVNCDNNPNCNGTKEKIVELHTTEHCNINSVREKRKKKNKKENSDEGPNIMECKDYFHSKIEEDLKDVSMEKFECKIKTEFMAKKDKKEKTVKSINIENQEKVKDEKVISRNMNFHSDQNTEIYSEVLAKEKIINREIKKTNVYKSVLETEQINKRKKKKEKLERNEINHNGFTKEESIDVNEKDNTIEVKTVRNKKKSEGKEESEDLNQGMGHIEEPVVNMSKQECFIDVESVKKKKKSKGKEEGEDLNQGMGHIEEPVVNMSKQECFTDVESVKKKKKKKDKKEKKKKGSKSPNQQSETEELCLDEAFKEKKIRIRDQENPLKLKLHEEKDGKLKSCCEPEAEVNERTQIKETNTKPSTKTIDKTSFIDRNKINGEQGEEKGVHQHKAAFLNEKRADKFYPGGYERVLRLTLWTNIAGFKGSNLEEVVGYGNTRKSERNCY